MHLGRKAQKLDRVAQSVIDDQGEKYSYGKLLLATGGKARRFDFGGDNIIYFRTLNDYRRLRQLASAKNRIAVIGGGFIGSEIAASLAINGCEVIHIFPEQTICNRVFPADLAGYVTNYYQDKGVKVLSNETITDLWQEGERLLLVTDSGREVTVGGVVAGIGIEPNTELALDAGLYLDNGIVVDDYLKTNDPNIFAAGDVANFNSHLLERRQRVEHEDNAISMGLQAGRNMAGASEQYAYQPYFYSDLFDLGYEAIGETDSRLETVADWGEMFRKGVIYYLRNGRVRGVLLWNVWESVDKARILMGDPSVQTRESLAGRIPI
jgi:NADPH-dependent 2,4-dienoyl-CoA reductase/sulfur reductase-like enzyme